MPQERLEDPNQTTLATYSDRSPREWLPTQRITKANGTQDLFFASQIDLPC